MFQGSRYKGCHFQSRQRESRRIPFLRDMLPGEPGFDHPSRTLDCRCEALMAAAHRMVCVQVPQHTLHAVRLAVVSRAHQVHGYGVFKLRACMVSNSPLGYRRSSSRSQEMPRSHFRTPRLPAVSNIMSQVLQRRTETVKTANSIYSP